MDRKKLIGFDMTLAFKSDRIEFMVGVFNATFSVDLRLFKEKLAKCHCLRLIDDDECEDTDFETYLD